MDQTRIPCTKCNHQKPLDAFNRRSDGKGIRRHGKQSWCKTCTIVNSKRWSRTPRGRQLGREKVARYKQRMRVEDPERMREMERDSSLYKLYRIRAVDFDAMAVAQGGVCAMCGGHPTGRGKRLHVDHDHSTGEIRALLCNTCNVGLGAFKEDPILLAKAIDYLNSHRRTAVTP